MHPRIPALSNEDPEVGPISFFRNPHTLASLISYQQGSSACLAIPFSTARRTLMSWSLGVHGQMGTCGKVMYTDRHTYTLGKILRSTQIFSHVYIYIHIHIYIYIYNLFCVYSYVHICMCVYMRILICACMQIRIYKYAYIHRWLCI